MHIISGTVLWYIVYESFLNLIMWYMIHIIWIISNFTRVDVFQKDYCFNQLELVGIENNIDGMVFQSILRSINHTVWTDIILEHTDVQPFYLIDSPQEAISLKTYRFIELFMHYFLPLTIAGSIIFSLLIEVTFRPTDFRRS